MCSANETCTTAYTQCISEVEKDEDGKIKYKRGCAVTLACTTAKAVCAVKKLLNQMDNCSYACCDRDNCNDKFPALDPGDQGINKTIFNKNIFCICVHTFSGLSELICTVLAF